MLPLFNLPDEPSAKERVLRAKTCEVCPLKRYKCQDKPNHQVDILVVSNPTQAIFYPEMTGYSTRHELLVECQGTGDLAPTVLSDASTACSTRKGNLITRLRPKIVLAMGWDVYSALEGLFGYQTDGYCDNNPLRTRYQGHDFWLVPINDQGSHLAYRQLQATGMIHRLMTESPAVDPISYKGLVFPKTNTEILEAFAAMTGPAYAFDYETTALRPYNRQSKLLSIAISDGDTTWSFGLHHPQTPQTNYDVQLVLSEFQKLSKRATLIAHNAPFEAEWSGYTFGTKFLKESRIEDTMAQAYILYRSPRSLDFLVRKYLGISLKKQSDINVENLINEPLEQVLKYNGLDAKYTFKLWQKQRAEIQAQGLDQKYQEQIDTVPILVEMQIKGVQPDLPFIEKITGEYFPKLDEIKAACALMPEARQFLNQFGVPFNPLSDKDVAKLHHKILGVSEGVRSFDEETLSTFSWPISAEILLCRDLNKLTGTYIAPLSKSAPHKNAGKAVHDDGLVHTIFKPCRTETGRLSSVEPNLQNQSKTGTTKFVRNWVYAPPGYTILSIDYGQMEYRMIAALSGDAEMIAAINAGLDVHKFWALRLNEYFNGHWIDDVNDPMQVANFRNIVKGMWVFALCFGSSKRSVAARMKISNWQTDVDKLIEEFWQKHSGVKAWHRDLEFQLGTRFYIENKFGRRYHAPLSFNQMINYPIQGTAADIALRAMVELWKLAHELDLPCLIPLFQIHDSLDFLIPTELLEDLVPLILSTMLDMSKLPWMTVPLLAEASVGTRWGEMKKLGEWSSEDF